MNSAPALDHRKPDHANADLRQHSCLQRLIQVRAAGARPGALRSAEHDVVDSHLSLATALARRYQNRGVEFEDLQQLARLGLVKAVKRWRPEIGVEFLPFAYPTILGEIKRYFRDQGSTIRVPRDLRDRHVHIQSLAGDLEQRLGHSANDVELAQESGIAVEQVRAGRMAVVGCKVLSLDELAVRSVAAQHANPHADGDLQRVEDRIMVRGAIVQLTDRERQILRLRYLDGMSQLKIGEAIGVSQMQVSRLVRGIVAKLRAQLEVCDENDQSRLAG